jgi:hypothetical protein
LRGTLSSECVPVNHWVSQPYLNLHKGSRNGIRDSLGDFWKPVSYELPSTLAEYDDRDFPLEQILLVANVSIRRNEYVKTGRFCGC